MREVVRGVASLVPHRDPNLLWPAGLGGRLPALRGGLPRQDGQVRIYRGAGEYRLHHLESGTVPVLRHLHDPLAGVHNQLCHI